MASDTNGMLKAVMNFCINHIQPKLDSRIEESKRLFTVPDILQPHARSRRWGWTHYGVFIPDIPEPYRYLNTMTLIGSTGFLCFDNDYLSAKDCRNTATVLSSTAYGSSHHYKSYDVNSDCSFDGDTEGTRLVWGDDLTIISSYPKFTVKGRYDHMKVDLEVSASQQVSWFVKSPLYDHLSLLSTYNGSITDARGVTPIAGLCTVEYARCMSPQSLTGTPLAPHLKLPMTFFTYQIINLDNSSQLLLTSVRGAGTHMCKLAHFRSLKKGSNVYDDISFEVAAYQKWPMVDRQGRSMRVPEFMRWIVREGGIPKFDLRCWVDSPLRYGHGRGYVGAYTFNGDWSGQELKGSGYFEWVDCE